MTGKTLVVVAGSADRDRLKWLSGHSYTLRWRVNGDFLLTDDRYLIARKGDQWLLLDHPPTVLTLKQQLLLALQSLKP